MVKVARDELLWLTRMQQLLRSIFRIWHHSIHIETLPCQTQCLVLCFGVIGELFRPVGRDLFPGRDPYRTGSL